MIVSDAHAVMIKVIFARPIQVFKESFRGSAKPCLSKGEVCMNEHSFFSHVKGLFLSINVRKVIIDSVILQKGRG